MDCAIDPALERALDAVHSDPALAVELADRVLRGDDGVSPAVRATALWARGQAHRETNDLDLARADLEVALGLAPVASALSGDVRVSLAAVLLYEGDTAGAAAQLDAASEVLPEGRRGRLDMQRAFIVHRLGDFDAALALYLAAIDDLTTSGDRLGAARAHSNVGVILTQTGRLERAADHLEAARELAVELGQHIIEAAARHNLGYLRATDGDLVGALRHFEAAEAAYRATDDLTHLAGLYADRAAVWSEARLLSEAVRDADRAMEQALATSNVVDLGETALRTARARLAAGDPQRAADAARTAVDAFAVQPRGSWGAVARWTAIEIDAALGRDERLGERFEEVAGELRAGGWTRESSFALVTAVEAFVAAGQLDDATRAARALGPRAGRSAVDQLAVDTARAVLYAALDDRRRAARFVGDGLRVARRHQSSIGSTELRALGATLARTLVDVGAGLAIAQGRPRRLLETLEDARGAIAGLSRPVDVSDPVVEALFADLRRVTAAIDGAGSAAERRRLAHQQRGIESEVQRRTRLSSGSSGPAPLRTDDAIDALGPRTLVEFVEVEGGLRAVVAHAGRCHLAPPVATSSIGEAIASIEFALNRLQRSELSPASHAAALDILDDGAARLDAVLPVGDAGGGGPLVIVPTGALHHVCWRVLPSLRRRGFTLATSLNRWFQASARPADVGGPTVAVAGPGLAAGSVEAAAVAAVYDDAVVLDGEGADGAALRALLPNADVVHLACHGTFRSDNPLFSSLRLADGDLSVYELEREERLPRVVVMSACHAARSDVVDGGGLLGMANALLELGVATVIAPLTPVNDARSVDLMVRLHTELAAGVEPSEALARAGVTSDGGLDPTAAPFVCFGR